MSMGSALQEVQTQRDAFLQILRTFCFSRESRIGLDCWRCRAAAPPPRSGVRGLERRETGRELAKRRGKPPHLRPLSPEAGARGARSLLLTRAMRFPRHRLSLSTENSHVVRQRPWPLGPLPSCLDPEGPQQPPAAALPAAL